MGLGERKHPFLHWRLKGLGCKPNDGFHRLEVPLEEFVLLQQQFQDLVDAVIVYDANSRLNHISHVHSLLR